MKRTILITILVLFSFVMKAGIPLIKLNESGSNYINLGMTHQIWLRYTNMNPNSGLYGSPTKSMFDVSLRRTRFVLNGQLTDKTYFFVQFGQNNFNLKSTKYRGAFFHDAFGEYHVSEKLHLGAGLTGLSGLLRNASPSVGSMLSLDAPLYQQATNSVNDQFLRKLSVYAKGYLGNLSYKVALTNPMAVQNTTTSIGDLNTEISAFSTQAPSIQYQAYLAYQFFDRESILNPYTKGTYLGAKKILAVGAGVIQQSNTMWLLNSAGDTTYHNMLLWGADIFYESKMDSTHNYSITTYGAYSYYDFGENYIRNVGVNNPVNTNSDPLILNGPGNNFPMIGTGHTFYGQVGYLKNINNEMGSKIQPYIASQISNYQYLDELMIMFEGGINWHIRGKHSEKLTLNYQNRPVYSIDATTGDNKVTTRKSMVQLQFQLGF